MTATSALNFLLGFVRDPKSCDGSSARFCAFLCIVTGCVVALKGAPNAWTAGVVTALVAGGGVALFKRVKSSDDDPALPAVPAAPTTIVTGQTMISNEAGG